jgi:hypothetical protein
MKIQIDSFAGFAPKIAPDALPQSWAQEATNVRISSGSLRALNTPSRQSGVLIAATKSLYSLGPLGGATVLSWNVDTDVARSPVSDNEYRIYMTDGVAPKKTSLALASSGGGPYPTASYNTGVPAPTAAMTAAAAAGTVLPAPTTWVYVYTHVTQFGSVLLEESAPSPPVTITTAAGANQAVLLTGIANPPTLVGYNYVYKRIYRTTGTTFQLVAQIGTATTSYTDNLSATQIPGDALPSTSWLPPPADLKGLISLPSGVMAGFRNNEIWFCEPGIPHAWPAKYMQALDSQIVAIKGFGNNIAVATQAQPYVGSGLYPDSFTFQKIARLEPCVTKRSMAADEFGAVYMSRNGLVSLALDGDSIVTKDVLTRQELSVYNPDSFMGIVFEGRYYGFYDTGAVAGCLVIGRSESVGLKNLELPAAAATVEPITGQMLFVGSTDNSLYSMDPTGTVPMTYGWKSKLFQTPFPMNMGAYQIQARVDPAGDAAAAAAAAANAAIVAANAILIASGDARGAFGAYAFDTTAFNGSSLQVPIAVQAATVNIYIYADSILKYTKEVFPNTVYRLPSGFKALNWEVRISGQREILGFEMAPTVKELKQ